MFKKNRASLNLELSLIIALLVISSVVGLSFLGKNISNTFQISGLTVQNTKSYSQLMYEETIPKEPRNIQQSFSNNVLSVSWDRPIGRATITGYLVQYDTNSEFSAPRSKTLSATQTSITIPIPPVNTFVKVKALGENNLESGWVNVGTSFKSNPTPIFTDNFNRANGTVGNGWTKCYPINVVNNQLSYTGDLNPTSYNWIWRSLAVNNYTQTITWTKMATADNNSLVNLSFLKDTGDYYKSGNGGYAAYFYKHGGVSIVYWHNGGVSTTLISGKAAIKEGSVLAFRKVGTTYQAIVDGKLIVETSHSAITTLTAPTIDVSAPYQDTNVYDDYNIYQSDEYNPI